ncbi:zinc finger CCCH domain-containing protein 37-like isoform X2 [Mangifera indica]|uniref:zinc finger CCCH domain-containing protein 37-like isoform X2 n=1 Tax=Mangifera indica TaxID=29780 RepID=UPI001CF95D12|nr:zinc finger CCCH domain-containing protein 37-like isoform X2 [Mangifera indica]
MANQLYGYNSSYASAGDGGTPTSSSSLRYLVGSSDSDHSKYASFSFYNDVLRYSSQQSWPPGVDPTDQLSTPIKRASQALYHQTLLGAHTTLGQSEAWYSTNSLAKRPRFESTSHLPVYPQRPGEKDCAYYMQTRTCKYGDTCKFDHPIWVPEGGIPDWKEVLHIATSESLPERPGEPDCPYFLKTQRCKFGLKCKFNHPNENLVTSVGFSGNADFFTLPDRPSEPPCAFYLKTGTCKFGATCKFHHPKDMQMSSAGQENGNSKQNESVTNGTAGDLYVPGPVVSYTPAILHNSKGLPIRPGEVDCPFYLKTGSCKYGATCRYNHPDRNSINPAAAAAAIGHPLITSPAASLNIGVVNPAASLYQTIDPRLAQPTLAVGNSIYPQRPGQTECDYYMKTGECKYGERCKFNHPIDRTAPTLSATKQSSQENVKLTLAGLPRRETGTCKYGATCKFDHPPPGEVMAMAALQGTSIGEVKGDENEAETTQSQAVRS